MELRVSQGGITECFGLERPRVKSKGWPFVKTASSASTRAVPLPQPLPEAVASGDKLIGGDCQSACLPPVPLLPFPQFEKE